MVGPSAGGRTAAEFEGEVEILTRRAGSEDVVSLEPAFPSGEPLPSCVPGVHIDLGLPNGLSPQCSLGDRVDDENTWRIGVLREPDSRGGLRWVNDNPQGRRAPDGARSQVTIRPQDSRGCWTSHASSESPTPRPSPTAAAGPVPSTPSRRCETWPKGSLHVSRFSNLVAPATEGPEFEVGLRASGLPLSVPHEASVLEVVENAGVDVLDSGSERTAGPARPGDRPP